VLLVALLLTGVCLLQIPPPRTWIRSDATPFDNGPTQSVAPAYSLLRSAATVVPAGASVLARTAVPDPRADTYFHRAAVALLPHRNVLPAALRFARETGYESEAEFVIILGSVSSYSGFRQVLVTPHGTVWRRLP
jgi:hypothetical protein